MLFCLFQCFSAYFWLFPDQCRLSGGRMRKGEGAVLLKDSYVLFLPFRHLNVVAWGFYLTDSVRYHDLFVLFL